MPYISWSPLFSVDVPRFDAQHRELLDLTNRFHDALMSGLGAAHAYAALNGLVRYAESHFADEERAMETHRYPERLRHAREHAQLVREVFELNERLQGGSEEAPEEIMEFLRDWLLQHVLQSDRKYGPFFQGRDLG